MQIFDIKSLVFFAVFTWIYFRHFIALYLYISPSPSLSLSVD